MRLVILIVLTSWAASCGQKGPLELPQPTTTLTVASASGGAA